MKIAAITMVYRDYWALSQWYGHFARHLAPENLFIIAHGADPMIRTLCPQASIITVPRDRLDRFDTMRSQILNGIRTGLLGIYDWVIQTDADELICLDPDQHASFADLFSAQTAPALFALGMNVAECPDDPKIANQAPALLQRSCAVFTGHYSKAWATCGPVSLARHGVALGPRKLQIRPLVLPRGVYLAHLKYASTDALKAANRSRRSVSREDAKGLPGTAWKQPGATAKAFFTKLEAMPEIPWDSAETEAYDEISAEPVRDAAKGILRTRSLRFTHRTRIPQRIRQF